MAATVWRLLLLTLSGGCLALSGCRASGGRPLLRPTHDDDAGTGIVLDAGSVGNDADKPKTEPHALLSVQPPHGPFSGGSLVLLRGNGFGGDARVWFGKTQVPAEDVLAIDPHRIQVTTPDSEAGPVDVFVQNGDDESTRVALEGGFAYDAFYADPAKGPTSGGTLVTIFGEGTAWDTQTTVTIDRTPCDVVEVRGPGELVCRAASGTPGQKPISVTTADGVVVDVLDAFSYENSDNGFRGGLSGDPLISQLKVLVFDSLLGAAVPGASVIVGSDGAVVAKTDRNGVALLDAGVGPKATITVARKCSQPATFVDIAVDTLTVYLDPVLSPNCFTPEGDLEGGGGTPAQSTAVEGELVWPESSEFRRQSWSNIPVPASDEENKVAYVFPLASRPTDRFRLPSAVSAITPTSPAGTTGVRFRLSTRPGNYTFYVLAGIENRSRGMFTAYAMGLLRGVGVSANAENPEVYIPVDVPLDHALTLSVAGPTPTGTGPNLIQASVAVRVGSEGYAILPASQKQTLLAADQTLDFIGIPALIGSLAKTSYVASVQAVTGSGGGLPRSVLGLLSTTSNSEVLQVGPFVEIPVLVAPERNGKWNGRDLAWKSAASGTPPDLAIVDIQTGGDLYTWRVVAPGATRKVNLPDLGAIDPALAWPSGEQSITITLAQVQDFDYGNLRYRNLVERGWISYAADAFFASF